MDKPFTECAAVIRAAAITLRQAADEIDRLAGVLEERQDPVYAASAIDAIVQLPQLCRVRTIATRAIEGA